MKRLKFILLFLLFTTGYAQAQWIKQEAGTSEALNDVFCISADTVLAVGNAGVILKTTDGGEHWIQKNSPFTGYLWKIRFADDTTGYAVGENGIIKTTDAGETWTILPVDEDSLYSVSCVNKDTVYISGLHGIIKKTEDGGQIWATQATGLSETVTNIQFINDTLGYAMLGTYIEDLYILKTINTGVTWQTQYHLPGGGAYSMFFCNDTLGYFGESSLYKSINQGVDWSDTFYNYWAYVYSIYCINPDTLWTAGWQSWGTSGVIAKGISTGDNYDDWNWIYHFVDREFYNSIHFANDTVGYVVGFWGDENSGWEGLIKKITTGENISAVENIQKNKTFTIYPNPSSGIITVSNLQCFSCDCNISISNISGKEIYNNQFSINNNQLKIDISNFSKGIYFLTISNLNHYETKKIIKL